jgi:hypothetical protein
MTLPTPRTLPTGGPHLLYSRLQGRHAVFWWVLSGCISKPAECRLRTSTQYTVLTAGIGIGYAQCCIVVIRVAVHRLPPTCRVYWINPTAPSVRPRGCGIPSWIPNLRRAKSKMTNVTCCAECGRSSTIPGYPTSTLSYARWTVTACLQSQHRLLYGSCNS